MKKFIVSGVIALSLVGAVASAQSYYPTQTYTTNSYTSTGCISITQNLSVGSRGSQVLTLQRFLVAQNYPGSGTWMETSYFGVATRAAVIDFQQSQGLPQTGIVDMNTQIAIDRVSCGGNAYTSPSYPTYPTYPTSPSYPYTYGAPVITSLSQNTGVPGNSVTIFGQGFDSTNNSVTFGGQIVSGIPSYNGTSIVFTVPYIAAYSSNQTLQLTVSDSRGTSNAISFTLNPNGTGSCGTYTYGTNCGCTNTYAYTTSCNPCGYNYSTYPYTSGNCSTCGNTYPYNYGTNCTNNTGVPTISYLNPQSGGAGTSVTIYGSGFSTSGNTVRFGNGIVTGLGSADGQSISFTVPSQLNGYGTQPLTLGTYNVSVTNANSIVSNSVPFTVTSTGPGNGSVPTITNVSGPGSLSVNQTGTWQLTINNPNASYATVSVTWGDTGNGFVNQAAPQTIYGGSQTVSFSHAYSNTGSYAITFTVANQSGQSQSYTSNVSVSGSNNSNSVPSISYLTPQSGYIGSQVTIYGSNFAINGQSNIVNFGSGAIQNVFSNGSSITFTAPSSVAPYCASGTACPQFIQQITPGSYQVSVMDPWGTSNAVSFTVL